MSDAGAAGKVVLQFGSAARGVQTDAAYRVDRMARFVSFQQELLLAFARRLSQTERSAREIWDGNRWLGEQREKWERLARAREASLNERLAEVNELRGEIERLRRGQPGTAEVERAQADWIAKLQEAKVRQEAQVAAANAELEKSRRDAAELRIWAQKLEEAKTWQEEQRRAWEVAARDANARVTELERHAAELELRLSKPLGHAGQATA